LTAKSQGRLVIVGTGIAAISQMTTETLAYIRHADIVFYHATNGVTATEIRRLNSNAVDLYEYYGEDKKRRITYIQMAELMLREVRSGLDVVGIFHGHPGYFVSPARRALAIAENEGYETALCPAVSAPDCLFADLRVDPGVFGCQILMASKALEKDCILATSGHVVFLQVSAVGDSGFSFSGYKSATLGRFIRLLIDIYGAEQESVYYMASVLPAFAPEIRVRKLADYLSPEGMAGIGAGILYLPPKKMTVAALRDRQAFGKGSPYGKFERKAVDALEHHKTPAEFVLRRASRALFGAMHDLGTNPSSRDCFARNPRKYVEQFPDLSVRERRAMLSKSAGSIRAVTSYRGNKGN